MILDSGELAIWRGSNSAPAGSMPVLKYKVVCQSNYADRTIGVTRYYTAKQHDGRADVMVRIKRVYNVREDSDLVTLAPYSHEDTEAYRILQLQQVTDEDGLPATDLTLERNDGIDAGTIVGSAGSTD